MKIYHFIPVLLFLGLSCLMGCNPTEHQQTNQSQNYLQESKEVKDQRMEWWRQDRFGMFIHWGLYAVPAGEWNGETKYGEWIRHTAKIPLETYNQFLNQFNPVKFNAREWVKMAKDAGMKYIVITSKHHDGFALFDSKYSVFDVMSTPFKRDILAELAVACKEEGIRLCFYHSIMDWHHPDYLPRREWETDRSPEGANFANYVSYMKSQLKELTSNYGEAPHVLWFDGEWENTWTHDLGMDLYNYVRNLKPEIIINNRVDTGREGMAGMSGEGSVGDFGTPEQEIPATGLPGVDWESCMTMNDNWGYNQADKNFKTTIELIRNLSDIASKGGNFLLNIGPKADGLFPEESIERLRGIGEWMKVNGEAIYGTAASPIGQFPWGRCTWKRVGNNTRLYVHIFKPTKDLTFNLPGIVNEPIAAFFLDKRNTQKTSYQRLEDAIQLSLKSALPDTNVHVIALDLKGEPDFHLPPIADIEHEIFIDEISITLPEVPKGVQVYYTLDGSIPDIQALLFKEPIKLTNSATIKARKFRDGKPISGFSEQNLNKVKPANAIQVKSPTPGLLFKYFEGDWEKVPDFSKLTPIISGTVKNLDRTSKNEKGEQYGFEFRGYLYVPGENVVTFYLSSDDGSKFWLNDNLLIDNDGLHGMGEKKAATALAKGYHSIRIAYFERTGGDDLKLSWKIGNTKKEAIPDNSFFHHPGK